MEAWFKITLVLCIYGVFKEIRPSEPFLTEYLEGPWINLTTSQVNHEVYPIWTYSYLFCLFIVLLVTDIIRYKPVIVFEAISYIITWALLLWGQGLFQMQMMQAVYGIATSTEVAYFTYIYSVVKENIFQKVTAYARAALLFGRFLSGLLSQVLISDKVMDFHSLNYISFACVLAALIFSMFLPSPKRGLYAHWEDNEKVSTSAYIVRVLNVMKRELKKSLMDRDLLIWSIWWSFSTCGKIQVGNYIQPLWEEIHFTWGDQNNTIIYNGAVEAIHTALSSIMALSLGFIQSRLLQLNEGFLAIFSFIDCILLIVMAWTKNIWLAYATYIFFNVIYQIVITIVSYHVAQRICPSVCGLIFGANTFVALIIQTLITLIFVDKQGLQLKPRLQYTMYGVYFGLLGCAFFILAIKKKCSPKEPILEKKSDIECDVIEDS